MRRSEETSEETNEVKKRMKKSQREEFGKARKKRKIFVRDR